MGIGKVSLQHKVLLGYMIDRGRMQRGLHPVIREKPYACNKNGNIGDTPDTS